ncbi:MAG: hypothetical protein ACHQ52_14650 [Candidatus Eisenbacteria bacterium]
MRFMTLLLVAVFALHPARVTAAGPDSSATADADLAKTARWFAEFDSLCTLDHGALWGQSFCGPIMIVDPASRRILANHADATGLLAARGGVFVGQLPESLPVANTAVEWQGTRWTMIMSWSMSENLRPRLRLMGHESFHRLQPGLGLESPGELNDHLDTADGRYWMQLEWNALQRALLAPGDARRTAITDALAFRAARRAEFAGAAEREVALEIHEGLAEYSGMRLTGYSDSMVVRVVTANRANETGFVRSFAYVSGPLYGYLLDASAPGWRRHAKPKTDLGDLLAGATFGALPESSWRARVAAVDVGQRALVYDGANLRTSEDAREHKRQAQLALWRQTLVDGPVLIVDLTKVKSGSFDPGKVFPMAEKQVVYTTRTLEAEWGALTIDDGAILEDRNTGTGRVSLAGASTDHSNGQGWTLKIADGWEVTPAQRPGDFQIAKRH